MKDWHKLKPELFKTQPYHLTRGDSEILFSGKPKRWKMLVVRVMSLTGAIALSMLTSAPAGADEDFIGVHRFKLTADLSDKFNGYWIMQRCSGLNLGLARFLPISEQQKKVELTELSSVFLIVASAALREKEPRLSKDAAYEATYEAVLDSSQKYYDVISENQSNTGSIFNEWLLKEIEACNEFVM
jgi:hypothetical protein